MEHWLAALTVTFGILKVIVGLGIVIFVHELGNFVVAKLCGVKCEKFYIGFDVPIKIGPFNLPRTFFKRQWGETEYGVGIIPLGGYVKMLGQDDNPANTEAEAERTRVRKDEDDVEDEAGKEEEFELDPRSYTAKSVPKRMAIISAGVAMNLVFAVIFATIAYRMGVNYTPCVIGSTLAGLPAWEMDLPAGARIIQIGRNGTESQHLRFKMDLLQNVGMTAGEEDLELLLLMPDGQKKWITVRPEVVEFEKASAPLLGIDAANETTLATKKPAMENGPAGRTETPFEGGDKIVVIEAAGRRHDIDSDVDLRAALAEHCDDELKITVRRVDEAERAAAEAEERKPQSYEVTIDVARNPMRRLGLVMTIGPITAIQQGSPATKAVKKDAPEDEEIGFKKGDVIQSVNGKAVHDPVTLPHVFRRLAGKEVEVEVLRGDETVTLLVTPRTPTSRAASRFPGSPLAVQSLGVAYSILNKVHSIDPGIAPENAEALAELEPGDQPVRILSVTFKAADKQKKKKEKKDLGLSDKKIPLGETLSWTTIRVRMQRSLPDTKVVLEYQRGEETGTVELAIVESKEWFSSYRGFVLVATRETHTAESWSEAASLGLRNTKESLMLVFTFLRKLVTGEIAVTNLGGPGMIAVVAYSEAKEGISRLLLFLTLLSANLAIINFLPIPVLDGGHMVFLTYEGIRGKPVNEKLAIRLTVAGLIFILGLMVFVIGLDFYHFLA